MLVTYTGKTFDFDNITKDSISIQDVLHSLPRINRFIGHSSRPYSVGEHTLMGFIMAEKLGFTPLQKLHWLKHDFTEAYVGDCPTPLKRRLPMFVEIEAEVEKAIEEHLGLNPITEEEEILVKRIDNTMLVLEMRDLTLHDYNRFVNELTYEEFLNDEDFVLVESLADDKLLSFTLSLVFKSLMKEVNIDYKGEF